MSEYKDVQIPFVKELNSLGYRTLFPMNEIDSMKDQDLRNKTREKLKELRKRESSPILSKILKENLLKLNPFLTESQAEEIVKDFTKLTGNTVENAKRVYSYISNNGYSYKIDGQYKTLKFMDFNNPENNEFLVVPEFFLSGNKDCYIDCQGFINGIPVFTKEDKTFGKFEEAMTDLSNYANLNKQNTGCPKLFNYSVFLIASTQNICQVGTVSGYPEHFAPWKNEKKGFDDNDQQKTLARYMLNKETLLDLIKNYVLFNKDTIVSPKYYQYYSCSKVVENLKGIKENSLLFKTQGSGKTFDMTFIANIIRKDPELSKNKLVYFLDRKGLSNNTMGTLGEFLPTKEGTSVIKVAQNGKELEELLKSNGSEIIVALIQKAGNFSSFVNKSKDIIIISDEAHRTNHGNLKAIINKCLPNATQIGMTGTPIGKTIQNYGKPLYSYTYEDSVEDGTTVRIIYEGVNVNLNEHSSMIDLKEQSFFKSIPQAMKDRLYKRNVNKKVIDSADIRIEAISLYIINHFKEHLLNTPEKAMIRAESKETGYLYYKFINELLQEDDETKHIKADFVISKDGNKKQSRFKKELENFSSKEHIDKAMHEDFKKDQDVRILIVVDMGTTGYNVPAVSTLYNDKYITPESKHSAFQWATRANRAFSYKDMEGNVFKKDYGRFIDFVNILETLTQAIKVYSDENLKGYDKSILTVESLKKELKPKFDLLENYLKTHNFSEKIDEDEYQELKDLFNSFSKLMNFLLPDPEAYKYFKRYQVIAKEMAKIRARRNADGDFAKYQIKYGQKIQDVAKENVYLEDPLEVVVNGLDIFSQEYRDKKKLIKTLSAEEKALSYTNSVKRHIKQIKDDDPVSYQKLSERVDEILMKNKGKWDIIAQEMLSVLEHIKSQTSEEKAYDIPIERRPLFNQYKCILELVKEGMDRERAEEFFNFVDRLQERYDTVADLTVNKQSRDNLITTLSEEFRDEYDRNKEQLTERWKQIQKNIKGHLNQMMDIVIKDNN